jgi:splicing factor 3B subunit 3
VDTFFNNASSADLIQAVGCEDQTVRIISLDPDSTLETISLQALTAPPSAICIAEMLDAGVNKSHPTMFVNIGLQNGVLLRTVLDPINGQLTDTRTRFLGTRPIRLVRVHVQGSPAIMALSSRSWLNYTHQNMMHFTPLIFENLDHVWSFSAELCPEGLIGIAGSVLRYVYVFCYLVWVEPTKRKRNQKTQLCVPKIFIHTGSSLLLCPRPFNIRLMMS